FWFGIQKRDKNIYLPCVGWIALNSAVIAGAVVYGYAVCDFKVFVRHVAVPEPRRPQRPHRRHRFLDPAAPRRPLDARPAPRVARTARLGDHPTRHKRLRADLST